MKYYIFDHPHKVTQAELDVDMLSLPGWRRKKAERFHFLLDRVLCTKAYLMLKDGLKECYGITEDPEFEYIGHDKPVLKGHPEIWFNISHCKRGILVVIDDQPIGCDIEMIEDKLDLDLCHYCYNEEEIAKITQSEDPCIAFTELWTRKEAYLKLTGEGLTDNLPSLFQGNIYDEVSFQTESFPEKSFVITICRGK